MKPAAASAALTSVALWAFDFIRLPRYELAQEAKLLTVHVAVGTLTGVLVALALRDRLSSQRLAAVSSLLTLTFAVIALLAMVGTYPQLFAERWWLRGAMLARVQVLVTHTVGPRALDGVCIALAGSVLLGALISGVRYHRRRTAAVAAVTAIALVTLAIGALCAPAHVSERPLSVLIVATESLTAIEDETIMPYTASRVADGSLYRYAVTPIARSYPAWVSTLTGTEPREHDVRHSYPRAAARREVGPTLFTELRDRGYFTFVAADAAGGVFSGFASGFEATAAPRPDVTSHDRGATMHRHQFSLALLRFRWFRQLFPEWRSVPLLADPQWVVDDALDELERAEERPFAGLVLFSSSQAPYLAPYPYYKSQESTYRGRYLYHRSPLDPPEPPNREDLEQIEERYLGALTATDRAIERLVNGLDERTLVIVTGAHGETLRGHGNTVRALDAQAAPVLLLGPGVPAGVRSDTQVRLYDLPATVLDLLGEADELGRGVTLFDADASRPVCVESGIWLDPHERENGLEYPGISQLVEIDPSSDEIVLREDAETMVESAKERGLVLDHRLYREQMTTLGFEQETIVLEGIAPARDEVDIAALFEERCVSSDPNLSRLYGAVVFERPSR